MPRSPWKLCKAILFSNGWFNHRGKSTEGRGPAARRHHGWNFELPASTAAVKEWASKAMEWYHQRCSAFSVSWCPEFIGLSSVNTMDWSHGFPPSPALVVAKLIACFPWISSTNYWHQWSGLAQDLQVNEDTHLYEHSPKAQDLPSSSQRKS